MGFYDGPLWASIAARRMELQRCSDCGTFLYPPAPVCPSCLSESLGWVPVSGEGKILSWIVYHRQYFATYPPPHNVIAVELDEGPVFVSNLEGEKPSGSWIGERVRICYVVDSKGKTLPRFELKGPARHA